MKRCFLALIFLLISFSEIKAGIVETKHNLELNSQFSSGSDFEGVCAYCHIPHSAKGTVLWRYEVEPREFGKIGNLCYFCHGTNRAGTKANKSSTVFNLKKDNHPVVGASNILPNVEDSDWMGEKIDTEAKKWPHIENEVDIECSSCHNPHDNRFGRFLNAPLFDTAAPEGGYNYEGPVQNFCSYCHQKRESRFTGKENNGTHPVGMKITNENLPGIFIDTAIFANPFGVLGGHLSNGTQGGVICVTCHSPHGVPDSRDGLYREGITLKTGPLLVIDNDATKPIKISDAITLMPDSTDIPYGGGGQSLLCEYCHKKAPYKGDTVHYFSHPVDRYPLGTSSNDNISSLRDTLNINYPPVEWINYEESGDPNMHQGQGKREAGEYLVCISCHDPHGAKPGTSILRKGSKENFCEDCHMSKPIEGESHPVDTVGINLLRGSEIISVASNTFKNRDNFEMAIRESVEIYESPKIFITDIQNAFKLLNGNITCRTCHAPHSGTNTVLLTVTDRNSEICECCHTKPGEPHNPSVYYFEGPEEVYPGGKANLYPLERGIAETFETPRLGSHYIGDVTPEGKSLYDTFSAYDTVNRKNWLATAYVDNGYNTPWPGSNQFSHLGGPGADPKHSGYGGTMIICQSCHTPHGAAKGLASDGGSNLGRLLLTPNNESQLCKNCHNPPGSHPVLDEIVSRTRQPINCTTSDYAIGYFSGEYISDSTMPADYPDTVKDNHPRMICESCHTAHNAATVSGAFIMEAAGDSSLPAIPDGRGWYNKRPPYRDHQPLCSRCHLQGIVDGK